MILEMKAWKAKLMYLSVLCLNLVLLGGVYLHATATLLRNMDIQYSIFINAYRGYEAYWTIFFFL
jgi:hypothetical protein